MTVKVIKTTIRLKRGTAAEWRTVNPILKLGEPGYVTDLNKLKVGNGKDEWDKLPYIAGSGGSMSLAADGNSVEIYLDEDIPTLRIKNFEDAKNGDIPQRGLNGEIQWINITDYSYSKEELDEKFDTKQVNLVPGEHIIITHNEDGTDTIESITEEILPIEIEDLKDKQVLLYDELIEKWKNVDLTDEESIIYLEEHGLSIKGYTDATQGQMLVKDQSRGLAWVDPVSDKSLREAVAEANDAADRASSSAIESGNQAVQSGLSADEAQETLNEVNRKIWFGTMAEYNALEVVYDDSIYCIIDED